MATSTKRKRGNDPVKPAMPQPELRHPSCAVVFPTARYDYTDDADTGRSNMKSVAESNVLFPSLLQSRRSWTQGGLLPRSSWSLPPRSKRDIAAMKNESRPVAMRLGMATVEIGPHVFPDTRFYSLERQSQANKKNNKAFVVRERDINGNSSRGVAKAENQDKEHSQNALFSNMENQARKSPERQKVSQNTAHDQELLRDESKPEASQVSGDLPSHHQNESNDHSQYNTHQSKTNPSPGITFYHSPSTQNSPYQLPHLAGNTHAVALSQESHSSGSDPNLFTKLQAAAAASKELLLIIQGIAHGTASEADIVKLNDWIESHSATIIQQQTTPGFKARMAHQPPSTVKNFSKAPEQIPQEICFGFTSPEWRVGEGERWLLTRNSIVEDIGQGILLVSSLICFPQETPLIYHPLTMRFTQVSIRLANIIKRYVYSVEQVRTYMENVANSGATRWEKVRLRLQLAREEEDAVDDEVVASLSEKLNKRDRERKRELEAALVAESKTRGIIVRPGSLIVKLRICKAAS